MVWRWKDGRSNGIVPLKENGIACEDMGEGGLGCGCGTGGQGKNGEWMKRERE